METIQVVGLGSNFLKLCNFVCVAYLNIWVVLCIYIKEDYDVLIFLQLMAFADNSFVGHQLHQYRQKTQMSCMKSSIFFFNDMGDGSQG